MFRCISIDLLALIEYCGPYAGLRKLRARGIPYGGKFFIGDNFPSPKRKFRHFSPKENFI